MQVSLDGVLSLPKDGIADGGRTKFPIKALGALKAVAADIEPVSIPNTIPPVVTNKERKKMDQITDGGGKGRRREEAIEID